MMKFRFTRPRDVLLILILASLAFGGSFECRSSTHDDNDQNTTR